MNGTPLSFGKILLVVLALAVLFGGFPAIAQKIFPQSKSDAPAAVQKKTRTQVRATAIAVERADILKNRWSAFAERLEKLSARIDSRLTKLEQNGFDGTTARAFLETANDRIAGARVVANDVYLAIIARAEKADGTGTELRRIETEIINPGKETVNGVFEKAKESLIDVLEAIP